VWACHYLEHLTPDRGEEFVREAYRALAPGGTLGIVVPDTREVMRRWLAGAIDEVEVPRGQWWRVSDLDHVCTVFLYSALQPSPHLWAYDRDTLARRFVRAGFTELREVDRHRDPRLGSGRWYQVGWEGVKP
jgi:predicted SAM-dependent methyltransferase